MVYLNNAATSFKKPPQVEEAVVQALRSAGTSARGYASCDMQAARLVAQARREIALLVEAQDPSRVIFTANATMALNTALFGLLGAGDQVITTDYEHNSVLRPLYALCQQRGVEISFIPVESSGSLRLDELDALFCPRTRAVVVTHASNVTGALVDVATLARATHQHGAFLVLDAAQTLGALPTTMAQTGADILCFTGHKALMGPQGTGGLVLAPHVNLAPLLYGGTGILSTERSQPASYPEHLEAGTANVAGLAGLAAGVAFVRSVGPQAVHARECMWYQQLVDGIEALPGAEVYGAHDGHEHTGTLAFNIAGFDASWISDVLATEFDIATRAGLHCAPRIHAALGTSDRGAVRLSVGWYTTQEEIDFVLSALEHIVQRTV